MSKTLLTIVVVFTGMLLLVAGCSDSDNNVNTENLSESIIDQSETMIYMLSSFWDDGLTFLDYGPGLAKPADTSYTTFDTLTYWWTYVRDHDLSFDDVDWMINELDSIRFNADGVYQREPDDSTDGLEMRIIGEDLMAFNSDSTWEDAYDIIYEIANADEDTVDIDGSIDFGLEVVLGTFEFEINFDCTYDNIRILRQPYDFNNYPVSGTMILDIHFHTTGDAANNIPAGTYTASMTLTFTPTGYSGQITVEGDNFAISGTWDELSGSHNYIRP